MQGNKIERKKREKTNDLEAKPHRLPIMHHSRSGSEAHIYGRKSVLLVRSWNLEENWVTQPHWLLILNCALNLQSHTYLLYPTLSPVGYYALAPLKT